MDCQEKLEFVVSVTGHKRLRELVERDPRYCETIDQLYAIHKGTRPRFFRRGRPQDSSGPVVAGLVVPVLSLGGAESWVESLVRWSRSADLEWSGCAVVGGEGSVDQGVASRVSQFVDLDYGVEGARRVAAASDVLVSWATPPLREFLPAVDPPETLVVCHSPVESEWGAATYRDPTGVTRYVAVSDLALAPIPESHRKDAAVVWNCVDPSRTATLMPRGVMRSRWGVPDDAPVAGYLGRFADEKRHQDFYEMSRLLPAPWHFVACGSGPGAEWLVERLEAEPNHRFILPGPTYDPGAFYQAVDVVVVPSDYESFGLTIAEAMWAGVPVVSTEVGLAKSFPGLTRVVPRRDPGALATAVNEAYRSPRVDPRRSQAKARELFSPDRFGREWRGLILGTSRRKPAPADENPPEPRHPSFAAAGAALPPPAMYSNEKGYRAMYARVRTCPYRERADGGCQPFRCWAGRGGGCGGRYCSIDDCIRCLRQSDAPGVPRTGESGLT